MNHGLRFTAQNGKIDQCQRLVFHVVEADVSGDAHDLPGFRGILLPNALPDGTFVRPEGPGQILGNDDSD